MSKYKMRKWIRKNNTIINVLLIIIGIGLYVFGNIFLSKSPIYFGLVTAIGTNIITNSLLLVISLIYFKDDDEYDKIKSMYEEKGLIRIYTEKNDTYEIINRNYLVNKKIIDYDIICCGGLSTLRKAEGSKIVEYVKNNHMKVRILTANPNSENLLQFKLDEEMQLSDKKQYNVSALDNTMKRDIYALYDWINDVNSDLPEGDKIRIKFYNSLPSLQYHRVGENLFISSRIIGAVSKSSPTYEYVNTGSVNDCFNMYTIYFEKLWNDPNFAVESPEVNLNPRLLINDNIINNILKLSCIDVAKCWDNCNSNAIRASLTVNGYPKPLEDNLPRRYNTNIARGQEILDINSSNGEVRNGRHIGYLAKDENHVVGRTINSGKTNFELIFNDDDCAILSIPILNGEKEVLATLNFDFRKELKQYIYQDESKTLTEQNDNLLTRARWWSALIATYLRVRESV